MIEWQIGAIPNATFAGQDAPPNKVMTAGWIKGKFGLDFRVYQDDFDDPIEPGWHLTHIPTGFSVGSFIVPLSEAMELADQALGLGDWDFTDPKDAKPYGVGIKDLSKEWGEKFTRKSPLYSPFFIHRNWKTTHER